jgi:hypothetical protein
MARSTSQPLDRSFNLSAGCVIQADLRARLGERFLRNLQDALAIALSIFA